MDELKIAWGILCKLWNWYSAFYDFVLDLFFGRDTDVSGTLDMPKRLYQAIENSLLVQGGTDKDGKPNYKILHKKVRQNPSFWTLPIDVGNKTVERLDKFEQTMEVKIAQIGYPCNLRIITSDKYPRIEVDRLKQEIVKFEGIGQYLPLVEENAMNFLPGIYYDHLGVHPYVHTMDGDSAFTVVSGVSGSGKTQFLLSALLTLAWLNDPKNLTITLVDGKFVDTMPLNGLAHFHGKKVITDVNEAVTRIESFVELMYERKRQLEQTSDYSLIQQKHVLIIDELSFLLDSLSKAEAEKVIMGLRVLSQTGRALGFAGLFCTQRIYNVDARAYSTCNSYISFRQKNSNDSAAAANTTGVDFSKMRTGQFEVFPKEQGVIGFYVDTPKNGQAYVDNLTSVVTEINEKWGYETPQKAGDDDDNEPQKPVESDEIVFSTTPPKSVISDKPSDTIVVDGTAYDKHFIDTLLSTFTPDIAQKEVIRVHRKLVGTSIGYDKARSLIEHFTQVVQQHATGGTAT